MSCFHLIGRDCAACPLSSNADIRSLLYQWIIQAAESCHWNTILTSNHLIRRTLHLCWRPICEIRIFSPCVCGPPRGCLTCPVDITKVNDINKIRLETIHMAIQEMSEWPEQVEVCGKGRLCRRRRYTGWLWRKYWFPFPPQQRQACYKKQRLQQVSHK